MAPIPDAIIPAEKPKEKEYDIIANNPLLNAMADLLDVEESFVRHEASIDDVMGATIRVEKLYFEFHARLKAGDKHKNWTLRSN